MYRCMCVFLFVFVFIFMIVCVCVFVLVVVLHSCIHKCFFSRLMALHVNMCVGVCVYV